MKQKPRIRLVPHPTAVQLQRPHPGLVWGVFRTARAKAPVCCARELRVLSRCKIFHDQA